MNALAERREQLALQLARRGPLDRDQVALLIDHQDLDRVLKFWWFRRIAGDSVELTDDGRRAVRELRRLAAPPTDLPQVSPGQKTCSKCHATLPIDDFPVARAAGKLYIRSWCKPCLKVYFQHRHQQRPTACAKS